MNYTHYFTKLNLVLKFNPMKYIFLIPIFLFFTGTAHSEIYKWVDENNKIHYGDKRPKELETEKIKVKVNTETSDYISSIDETEHSVIIYTNNHGRYCKIAKEYFEQNNIAYTEYNIEKDADAKKRYDEMGMTIVPVIFVGEKRLIGFSVGGFKKIYTK